MKNHEVFQVVKNTEVPQAVKILTSTWGMKQKADGTKHAQVTARGYEQNIDEHS